MSQIMSDIKVNDIFDDLFSENQRLLKELLVTKKCLKVLSEVRVFIELLFTKYGHNFEPKDSNHYHRMLAKEVDKVLARSETTGDKDNDQKFNEESDDTVVDNERHDCESDTDSNIEDINDTNDGICDDMSEDVTFKDEISIEKRPPSKTIKTKTPNKQKSTKYRKTSKREVNYQPLVDRPFKCDQKDCWKSFATQTGLSMHKHIHTPDHTSKRQFPCPDKSCKMSYISEITLRCHQIIEHSNAEEFACDWDECEYRSTNKNSFRHHYITHEAYRYPCQWPGCDRSFALKSCLEPHMATHRKEKTHACHWPECGYVTYTMLLLRQHLITHSQDYKFECSWPECGQKFKRRHHLKQHILTKHSDPEAKRFVCHECDYRFASRRDLERHLVVHSDARPFICDVDGCHKGFKTESILKSHKKSHSSDRIFKCSVEGCDKRFKWNRHLKQHIINKHGGGPLYYH